MERREKPVNIKKVKEIIDKSNSLRKIIDDPEEEIAKASLLNAKNLYRLLRFLRDIYPIGYSFKGIKEKLNLEIFSENQLDTLRVDGLIVKRNLEMSEEFKKNLNPNFLKMYPEYAITNKGMEFVNSIEVRDLSEDICWLTKFVLYVGGLTIIIGILQIIIPLIARN